MQWDGDRSGALMEFCTSKGFESNKPWLQYCFKARADVLGVAVDGQNGKTTTSTQSSPDYRSIDAATMA